MPSNAPWFKQYAESWLVETSLMTPEQEGAFARLLCYAWNNAEAPCMLPNDDAELAAMSRLGTDRWKKSKARLLKHFLVDPRTEMLYHPAQYEQWLEMQDAHRRRSSAGARGGRGNRKQEEDAEDPVFVAVWQTIRENYPARAGGQGWRDAYHAARARIREGAEPADLEAGTLRYKAYIEANGDEGTQWVMQARRFFGPGEHFKEEWKPPVKRKGPVSVADRQRQRIAGGER
jgi:uncharacterized protein YdaU (DUF1376 family)